jgi:hypothetical protein
MKNWQEKLEKAISGIGDEVSTYIEKEIEKEVREVIGDITFYPKSDKPGVIVYFAAETECGEANLKKELKDWFDEEHGEYPCTKEQLEAWAKKCDDIAKMIRGLITDGKFKKPEDDY